MRNTIPSSTQGSLDWFFGLVGNVRGSWLKLVITWIRRTITYLERKYRNLLCFSSFYAIYSECHRNLNFLIGVVIFLSLLLTATDPDTYISNILPMWNMKCIGSFFSLFDSRMLLIQTQSFWHKAKVKHEPHRFYAIYSELNLLKDPNAQPIGYDAEHERRRKEQLRKQLERTQEDVSGR